MLTGFSKSTHTGNGSTVTFTLSFVPQTTDAKAYVVTVDGVFQIPDTAYTIDATAITFTEAPPTNANVCVLATAAASTGTVDTAQVTASGSTTARALNLRFAEVYNVKDYGATGDGATDDAPAIQAALDAADAASGGTVYAPDGEYLLGSGLIIYDNTHLELAPNAKLIRDFVGSKPTGATIYNELAVLPSGDTPSWPGTVNSNIQITGGQFSANDAADTGPHISLYGVEYFRLDGIKFTSVHSDWNVALYAKYGEVTRLHIDSGDEIYEDGIHVLGGEHIQVSDCYVKCGDDALVVGNPYNLPASDITFTNCTVYSEEANAIKVHQTRGGSLTIDPTRYVERITFSNITGYAGQTKNGLITLYNSDSVAVGNQYQIRDITITNVVIQGGTIAAHAAAGNGSPYGNATGVRLEGGEDITFDNVQIIDPIRSAFLLEQSKNVTITGCRANSPSDDSGTGRQCVDSDGTVGLRISDCDFYNDAAHMVVRLDDTTDATIVGNRFRGIDAGLAGILMNGTTTNVVIANNVFEESASGGYGIWENSASVEDIVISGNEYQGVTTPLRFSNIPERVSLKPNETPPETLTVAAPTLLSTGVSLLDSTSNAVDGTLGSGFSRGDIKTIVMTEASNSSTVSVTNHETSDPEVFTFADVDDTLVLMWTGTEWITIANSGVAT